ncbi:ribosome recycling factor [Aurantimonas manganoxydans SI85-9A1]|uniref:Ribosome-recycling factor n=2 Tax=Aurantimonas manganoxydans TaxID=651183 RepID=Q1YI44_AURMS|nr:ribosome recycling factor [Aurantimonas manganoxydans]EAS50273.1 ribosome recycling factor [Aurantimonas manganoxydans SI85-9A1]BAT29506.1 ribosome recycling factor [Aurantimonas manganoxydans SI85-9A1]
MADMDLNELKRRMDGAITSLKSDLTGLRTGRASPSLLDPIYVDAYGSKMPLNQVANVSVPEPRMVTVTVWDKQMVGKVERAIRESNLGLNPITDGATLRIPLPELNEQRRKELVKVAHQYAEGAKVAVRHVRRDGMETLKKLEKDGDIGQDESRQQSDRVQKMTDETISEIDSALAVKEAEIMQV